MLSGARDAGCFREVAALHSNHLRQVPLYSHNIGPERQESGDSSPFAGTVRACS